MKITALNLYPIKGVRGVPVTSAILTSNGLLYDRQWMVVKAESGKHVTQREVSKMSLVLTALPSESSSALPADAVLTVTAPGMQPLKLQLQQPADAKLSLRTVTCWEWTGQGADEGDEAAKWFSDFLGIPVRLVRYLGSTSPAAAEATAESPVVRYTEPGFAPGKETRFSDGYPCLLANEASLVDLNSRLAEQQHPALLPNRFRPNIWVGGEGAEPWGEDNWESLAVKGAQSVDLKLCKPCGRCKVTTIEQEKGAVQGNGDEPLKTLGTFRSGAVLGWDKKDKTFKHQAFFGWNAVWDVAPVEIKVGDEVVPVPRPAGTVCC